MCQSNDHSGNAWDKLKKMCYVCILTVELKKAECLEKAREQFGRTKKGSGELI